MQKLICLLLPFLFFSSIYEYSLISADGKTININDYQGKKILIVNTAGNSTEASQYARLQELYEQYEDSLIVIAIPSNSFGNEQDDDSTLYNHITIEYGISYPVAVKSEVLGDSTCELYQWLTHRALNNVMDNVIYDDFQKFLIDESGNLIGVFSASVDPLSPEIRNAITGQE
jgi:glutathione peroxidase